MSKITHNFDSHESWRQSLQKAPNAKWIIVRDLSGGKKSRYIPLPIQEALADMFFREFDIIETDIVVEGKQIMAQVKISVLGDYPDAEHRIISGVGAKVQTKGGNSLEYGARSAKNAAKSEALTDFANIFGRNLNRGYDDGFSYIKKRGKKVDDSENNEKVDDSDNAKKETNN